MPRPHVKHVRKGVFTRTFTASLRLGKSRISRPFLDCLVKCGLNDHDPVLKLFREGPHCVPISLIGVMSVNVAEIKPLATVGV